MIQVQNLDKAVCISLYANVLQKGMNSFLLPSALVQQPILRKENFDFKPASLCLKFWPHVATCLQWRS